MRPMRLAIGVCGWEGEALEALRQPSVSGEETALICPVCGREAAVDLCSYHQAAKENVLAAYLIWVKAYGGAEWKGYLSGIKRNVQTGQWAKEMAEYLEDA